MESLLKNLTSSSLKHDKFVEEVKKGVDQLMLKVQTGEHVTEIEELMGKGKRLIGSGLIVKLKFYYLKLPSLKNNIIEANKFIKNFSG